MKVERTLTSEFVNGLKVAAYMEEVPTGFASPTNRFSTHWSTPGAGAQFERLFSEKDVLALQERLDTEIEVSNKRGNHIEFELLPQMAALETENKELREKVATLEVQVDALDKARHAAEVNANFFQEEVKLRNRLPVSGAEAADVLRRAEAADSVEHAAQVLLTAMERAQIDMSILNLFYRGQPATALRALIKEEPTT